MGDVLTSLYDRASDVLYIVTDQNAFSTGAEGDPGLIWRHAEGSGALVGLTVIDFDAYWRERMDALVGQVSSRFRVSFNAARSLMPAPPDA